MTEHICTDEREQAIAYTTLRDRYQTSVPALWDGTPFVVDISSTFPATNGLLDTVRDEAERIRTVLGYQVFAVGEARPFEDLTTSQLYSFDSGSQLVPPERHIEIRRCHDTDGAAGISYPWWRMIVLENDAFQSRHIITHELYHILGFVHPGAEPGVAMSELLMSGPGQDARGWSIPTASTPSDLAKLACIYPRRCNQV